METEARLKRASAKKQIAKKAVSMASTLHEMSEMIVKRKADGWWQFPAEPEVEGFMGTGQFIVGDQPSTSDWEEKNRNRRAFYDLLPRIGVGNAHLTDFYKRRGKSGTLRKRIHANEIPADLMEHIEFLRAEIALLNPSRIVALGHDAHWLLKRYVPEVLPILSRMWHFSYVVRCNKTAFYEDNARVAFRL
jgi:hypothetical protein